MTSAETTLVDATEELVSNGGSNEASSSNTRRDNSSTSSYVDSYIRFFRSGTLPVLIAIILISIGLACVTAVIPDIVADRYARIRHDYSGPDCATIDRLDKPDSCQKGADDAQSAAAASTLALNLLTLIINPVVGSYSDSKGRRTMILMSLFLYTLGPIVFVLLQLVPWLTPDIYYLAVSLAGAVDLLSMTFAAISDVLPEEDRAAGYGISLAGFYLGFSGAPSLALIMTHFQVSILSCSSMLLAFIVAFVALPETLPRNIANESLEILVQQDEQQQQQRRRQQQRQQYENSSYTNGEDAGSQNLSKFVKTVSRPIRDMSILAKGSLPVLAAASFFSAMVYSSDKTFVVYYIMDELNVRDADIAKMFAIFGPVGVIIQAFFIQPLLRIFGEKQLLIITFLSGTFHNALYGLARNQLTIIAALCLSQLTKVNYPILASYASRSASIHEQGRIQGALFALNALANAVGPMILEVVYDRTKNGHNLLGPGAMFLCASMLYLVGTVMVSFLPPTETTTGGDDDDDDDDDRGAGEGAPGRIQTECNDTSILEPLLMATTTDDDGL